MAKEVAAEELCSVLALHHGKLNELPKFDPSPGSILLDRKNVSQGVVL